MGLSLASLPFMIAETLGPRCKPSPVLPHMYLYKYMISETNHHHTQIELILTISSQRQESVSLIERQVTTMISSKKLAQLSKKWQGMGAVARRRVTTVDKDPSCSSVVAGKGNCVVYSSDGKRFEIPLTYLHTRVFAELLKLSQEEFGYTSDERITLPCDTAVMEYVMCLLRREASEDVEKALSSIVMPCHHQSRMVQPSSGFNHQFALSSS